MDNKEKIYKLTDLDWLFSKIEGMVEPVLVIRGDFEKGIQVISAFDGKSFEEAGKMLDEGKTETDSLIMMNAHDAVKKYATRTPNAYAFNLKFFEDDGFGSSFDEYVEKKRLSKDELKKLAATMTKAYKKDYNKIDLSRVNWLVDSKELSVEPFAFSLDSGVAYSLISGEVMKKLEEIKNETNSQSEVLTSYEAIVRYAMHKPNRYSFEEKVLEDGLYVEGRLVSAEHLKKLTALLKEGLEKEAQKAQLNQQ